MPTYDILQKCQTRNSKNNKQLFKFISDIKMKNNTLSWSNIHDVKKVSALLEHDNVIACTTDTILGLLARANEQGYRALNALKQREKKPYVVLVDTRHTLTTFLDQQPTYAEKIIDACWPGPLTLILPTKPTVFSYGDFQRKVAFRIPNHDGLQKILRSVGPLFSTSANIAGHPFPKKIGELDDVIKNNVAAVITSPDDPLTTPSTIIDCTHEIPQVIREGAYPISQLEMRTGIKFSRNS